MKEWGRKQWAIAGVAGFLILGGIGNAIGGKEKPAPVAPVSAAPSVSAVPTPTESPSPAEPLSSGGIGFFEAASACDNHIVLQMPGRAYKSHLVIGKRGAMPGVDPAQFIATYDAKLDGAPVVVTCVVDGDASHPNVVRVAVDQG